MITQQLQPLKKNCKSYLVKSKKMKQILAIIFSCLMVHSYGQVVTRETDAIVVETPTNIITTKTDKHVNIPGTRAYFIPLFDFKIATTIVGLQKSNGTGIQIMDLVGGNYFTNTATFTKEAFEKKGVKVFQFEEISVNKFIGKYVVLQANNNQKAIEVAFGDSTFATLITALYDAADVKTETEIKQELKTLYYDKNLEVDPFATAAFTLDESKSIYKFSRSSAGIFIYSIGGVKDTAGNQPFITVTTVPKDTFTAKSISKECLLTLEKYGLVAENFDNTPADSINGMPAFETEISGKVKNKISLVYQLVVIGKVKAVIVQGIINSDFTKNEKEMKNLARTIKLK